MNLRSLTSRQHHLNEDFITLDSVLNGLTRNSSLKALLAAFAMCYGVKPQEISFANHSRLCLGVYESVARVKGGGGAIVKAFETKFKDLDIEICCGKYIVELADIRNHRAGRFILNTGEEISGGNCIFTIHPREILKILPEKHLSRAFIDRGASFESSAGFFSVFATLEPEYEEPDFGANIFSIFPHSDINQLLDPEYKGVPALVIIKSTEQVGEKNYRTITAFEPSFVEHVEAWRDSKTGMRPQAYQDYKKKRVKSITERIVKVFPEYKDRLNIIDAASVLTFRDYLNNYDGSAYGVKQKVGQYNFIGKLPIRNLYAAGQSSLLPGIVGAMMSSFIVGRSLINEDEYNKFLNRNLWN